MDDALLVEGMGRLELVGLDAADVVGLLGGQGLHQGLHGRLEEGGRRLGALRRLRDRVRALWPH